MKKVILTSVAAVAFAMIATTAGAVDSTGCGLGSMVWRGHKGIVPQILAVTTNGTWGNQTFGITTGTLGCDPEGRVTGGTGRMLLTFLENNMEQYALDASRGQGETLYTVAGILGVPVEKVAAVSQANFDTLFPDENTEVITVATNLMNLLSVPA